MASLIISIIKRICSITIGICAVLGIMALIPSLLFVAYITWKMPLHNYQLGNMQRHFRSTMQSVHPAQAKLLAEMAEFGNFGESNHCDYMVGEFRSSPLSKEEILKKYTAVATSSFIGNRLIETGIYFIDEEFFKKDYLFSGWLEKYLPDRRHITNENIYLIYSEDAMNPPDGDIRCH